jgi:hypothetical protein
VHYAALLSCSGNPSISNWSLVRTVSQASHVSPVARSTPDRSDAVMREATVMDSASDEETKSFLVHRQAEVAQMARHDRHGIFADQRDRHRVGGRGGRRLEARPSRARARVGVANAL